MFKYIFTLIALFSFSIAIAQTTSTVRGKLSLANGDPAAQVTVQIEGTNLGSVSDSDGFYMISNIPSGSHYIIFSSIDIKRHRQRILVDKEELSVNVKLVARDDTDIEEVAVSGKTVKRNMETSGFAVGVIETKEASLRNLTTNELLDRAVGVRVRQNGGEGSPIEYNLNGMSGSTIGLFLDGIEISTYGSSFNLNNIPPAMIERIEVYKGVLPAHLSGNYVGGAINVVMKKDASANNITASVSYGSFNTYRADIGGLYRNQKKRIYSPSIGLL